MQKQLTNERIAFWVETASRAPSAHNTQPARWWFSENEEIWIFEDVSRRLVVADGSGFDQGIALGAAFEGLNIAASEDQLLLDEPDFSANLKRFAPEQYRPIAGTKIAGRRKIDSLAPFVFKRATFRGKYRKLSLTVHQANFLKDLPSIKLITSRDEINYLAELHEKFTCKIMENMDYYTELFHWLRFSPKHPSWNKDGLSGTAMSMGNFERWLGSWLGRPEIFRTCQKLGLARLLLTEKSAVRSCSALIIFASSSTKTAFDIGREFYRLWLTITSLGLALCPMSAMVDYPEGRRLLNELWPFSKDMFIVNVFRVGFPPPGLPLPSARLSADELILK